MTRWLSAFVLATLVCSGASADEPKPTKKQTYRWDVAWPHANAWDYTLTGVFGTALIVETVLLQPNRPTMRWSDPILFDVEVREALRLRDGSSEHTAVDKLSWGLWLAQLAYPIAVDVPYALARHGPKLAWDLFWQDAVVYTLAGAVDLGLRDLTGRARPYTYECVQSGGGEGCFSSTESPRSFPGGHITTGTAAAVLSCTQHMNTRLYGGPWDAVLCASMLTSNAVLAVTRVMTDNHWATDQIAGMAIGALIGFGVPWIMHYRWHTPPGDSKPRVMVYPTPVAMDRGFGVGIAGIVF